MISKILPAHCTSGRKLVSLDGVIVHYISAKNVDPERAHDLEAVRDLMIDLNRPRAEREHYMLGGNWPEQRMYASAHLLIGQAGEVWKLVEFDRQAYHAGKSELDGRKNCNTWTLGIELVGGISTGFTREQYLALVNVLIDLEARYGFSRRMVAGHDLVRWNAIQAGERAKFKYDPSGRKDGQGDNFDWYYLGKLWNDRVPNPEGVATLEDLPAILDADPLSG